ncbi:MAG TPA: hypothetical protein VN840_15890, partial [Streptosporangiaceae bacterium]|nr:hypothetical protein [Streptosporangiaceae bacterium]
AARYARGAGAQGGAAVAAQAVQPAPQDQARATAPPAWRRGLARVGTEAGLGRGARRGPGRGR